MQSTHTKCPVCHGRGELTTRNAKDSVVHYSCNFCDGKGYVIIADEHCDKVVAAHNKLLDAVKAVYYAAWYKPDRGDDEEHVKLWTTLRDAAGFRPGGATLQLGPRKEKTLREQVKAVAMAAMYSPELWTNGGLDPRNDVYGKITESFQEKPFVIFPTMDSPRNMAEAIGLPLSRIRPVVDSDMLRGLAPSTVIYDPYGLSQNSGNGWGTFLRTCRLNNVVCGKALVSSVLAARFGL
jgi:hypothetical protein